jgi:hypothetical protein
VSARGKRIIVATSARIKPALRIDFGMFQNQLRRTATVATMKKLRYWGVRQGLKAEYRPTQRYDDADQITGKC